MTDEELIAAEADARRVAHGCPVYLGSETYHATRSGQRATAAADRWMALHNEMKKRGLA
jgi:hypothetical protein